MSVRETTLEDAPAIRQFPFDTDAGVGGRALIGLIVLASDHTIEYEYRLILRELPGVALYESRIFCDSMITPDTLRAMEPGIAGCASVILPGTKLDVVGFGCTSASMVIGQERVSELIRSARPESAATNPVTAAFAAFAALGAKRIAVLTPYSDVVNEGIRAYFEAGGVAVPVMGSFKEPNDNIVAKISPATIAEASVALLDGADVDALFVSCTSLRLVEVVGELERRTGLPVTSSNHALAWHSLRLAGVDDRLPQFGRLFETGLSGK
ncbi:MAG: hypothetical protein AB7L41_00890 [Flavobacteriaceae bacterium]